MHVLPPWHQTITLVVLICLFVCLSACMQHYLQSYKRIKMKFYGGGVVIERTD